jgi:hypothetical protein
VVSETGKGCFVWNPEHQKAFQIMKALIAQDCMLQYPNHNKPFDIYKDVSSYQLGAKIVQEGVPVTYFSQKLKYLHIARDYNFLTSMFSQLERLDENSPQTDTPSKRESNFSFLIDDNKLLECFLNLPDELLKCFLNFPDAIDLPFVLDLERISQGQQNDPALLQQ